MLTSVDYGVGFEIKNCIHPSWLTHHRRSGRDAVARFVIKSLQNTRRYLLSSVQIAAADAGRRNKPGRNRRSPYFASHNPGRAMGFIPFVQHYFLF
jgi:hypothetical protein